MLLKKERPEDGNLVQKQFTKYLKTAIKRKKKDIVNARITRNNHEVSVDFDEYLAEVCSIDVSFEDQMYSAPATFEDMVFDNEKLEDAMSHLTKRDLDVLFAKEVLDRHFNELAAEYGISYKGITSICSRAKHKIRNEMEGKEK